MIIIIKGIHGFLLIEQPSPLCRWSGRSDQNVKLFFFVQSWWWWWWGIYVSIIKVESNKSFNFEKKISLISKKMLSWLKTMAVINYSELMK